MIGDEDTSGYSIQGQRYISVNPPTPTSTPSNTATPQPPTAVDLRYFRAIGLADRAILVWETASAADTLGFQVLRAASPEGPWAYLFSIPECSPIRPKHQAGAGA